MSCKVCVVVCILALVAEIYTKPVIKSGVSHCYKQECPENTYACEKISTLTDNKKDIIHNIKCLGLNDQLLQNFTTFEKNPFGPQTYYKGYSYSGVYEYSNSFTPKNEVSDSDKSSNSEVEDLNIY